MQFQIFGEFWEVILELRGSNGRFLQHLRRPGLFNRAINIISSLTGLDIEDSKRILLKSNKSVKNAIIMHELKVSFVESEKLLRKYDDSLRDVLDEEKR